MQAKVSSDDSQKLLDSVRAAISLCTSGSSKDVEAAQEALNARAGKPFKLAIMKSDFGKDVWADAETRCAAGALDDHSVDLLAKGIRVFSMDIMPVSEDFVEWSGVDISDTRRGQYADLLADAFADVLEAFQQWSEKGIQASVEQLVEFFGKLLKYINMCDVCEWAACVEALRRAPVILSYAPTGDATALCMDTAVHEEAKTFLGHVGNANFMRGSFVNLLRRLDEAKGRLKIIGDACSSLTGALENLVSVEVPRLRQHCEYRAGLMGEMGAICAVMQSPAPASARDLVQSYGEDKDKSLLKMACDVAEASAYAGDMDCPVFHLYGNVAASGEKQSILSSADLVALLDGVSTGIGMGTEIVDVVLVGSYKQVTAAWADASCPAWRLLDAAPTARGSDSSPLSLLGPLLGAEEARGIERSLDEGARNGDDIETSLNSLSVKRTCDVLNVLVETLAPLDGEFAIEWLSKVWSPVEGAGDDADARQEKCRMAVAWCQVVTKAAQLITLAAHLAQRYDANNQAVTVSQDDDMGTATHTVDPYVVTAVTSFNELAGEIASECQAGGESFEGFASKCAAFAKAWGEDFWEVIAAGLSERLHRVSQATRQLTPGWKSFITDTKYSKQLAVKHLLVPSAMEKLPRQSGAQFELQKSIAEAFAAAGAQPPSEHPGISKTYKNSSALLDEAQDSINIVAAVEILEKTKASSQPACASMLLDSIGERLPAYPSALVKLLQALKTKKI